MHHDGSQRMLDIATVPSALLLTCLTLCLRHSLLPSFTLLSSFHAFLHKYYSILLPCSVVFDAKTCFMLFHVKQDDLDIPEIGTRELYRTLFVLKFHDVYNCDLLKLIRLALNDRPELFEEFYDPYLSLQHYDTRNSRFYLPPVKLDVERNFPIFQSIKCFNVASTQLCVPMSTYALKTNYKKVVLES